MLASWNWRRILELNLFRHLPITIYDSTDAQYTGTLITLVDGNIGASGGFMMDANLTGDLSNGTVYATDIALDGWFIGDTYDAVGGYADITIDGGLAKGVFIAEQ